MKAFLKENAVLIISLSLPLILVALFSIVQFASNIGIAPPQYSVIFATGNDNQGIGYNVYVKENEIHYTYKAPPKKQNNYNYYNNNKPRVFVYDPVQNTRTELEAPEVTNFEEDIDVVLKDVPKGKIVTQLESPDGYILETSYYRNGNVFSEIFGGYNGRSRYDVSLKKNNKRVAIPTIDSSSNNYYDRNTRFLGWITEDK
ncbi:MAG TPA: hypothetical protein PLF01_06475 [Alphaproteobacteria bacterium]|nr:hypothetical protein [Alphaproteobacteria bacterium]